MSDAPATLVRHELLLALAGRIDDDLLAWARELIAVGEDDEAIELIVGTLLAERVVLPAAVRETVNVLAEGMDVGPDPTSALELPVNGAVTEHRFGATPEADPTFDATLAEVADRMLTDCRVWRAWRLTPSGGCPGPVPHPVVLVELGTGAGTAPEILAYQVADALKRAGHVASVEVFTANTDVPDYHQAAMRDAEPVTALAEQAVADELGSDPDDPGAPGEALPVRSAGSAGAGSTGAGSTGVSQAGDPFAAGPLDAGPLDGGPLDAGPVNGMSTSPPPSAGYPTDLPAPGPAEPPQATARPADSRPGGTRPPAGAMLAAFRDDDLPAESVEPVARLGTGPSWEPPVAAELDRPAPWNGDPQPDQPDVRPVLGLYGELLSRPLIEPAPIELPRAEAQPDEFPRAEAQPDEFPRAEPPAVERPRVELRRVQPVEPPPVDRFDDSGHDPIADMVGESAEEALADLISRAADLPVAALLDDQWDGQPPDRRDPGMEPEGLLAPEFGTADLTQPERDLLDPGSRDFDQSALDPPRFDRPNFSPGDLGPRKLGPRDLGPADLGSADLGSADLGPPDSGLRDLGRSALDRPDLGPPTLGATQPGAPDFGDPDLYTPPRGYAGTGSTDLGLTDLGQADLGPPDLGPPDLGRYSFDRPDLGTRDQGRDPGRDQGRAAFGRPDDRPPNGPRRTPWSEAYNNGGMPPAPRAANPAEQNPVYEQQIEAMSGLTDTERALLRQLHQELATREARPRADRPPGVARMFNGGTRPRHPRRPEPPDVAG